VTHRRGYISLMSFSAALRGGPRLEVEHGTLGNFVPADLTFRISDLDRVVPPSDAELKASAREVGLDVSFGVVTLAELEIEFTKVTVAPESHEAFNSPKVILD